MSTAKAAQSGAEVAFRSTDSPPHLFCASESYLQDEVCQIQSDQARVEELYEQGA